jgi:phosphatidylinositol 4-kinase
MLYWTPVNPITAVTFFLPAYRNHPYIIQYAMRALESHSIDVMFFYVYQIVQTLRYDALGYVERYIIETAKFSQLFAHQIIWNMKANVMRGEGEKATVSLLIICMTRLTRYSLIQSNPHSIRLWKV